MMMMGASQRAFAESLSPSYDSADLWDNFQYCVIGFCVQHALNFSTC